MTLKYEITKTIRKIRKGKLECDVLKFCFIKDCDNVYYNGKWVDYKLKLEDKMLISSGMCDDCYDKHTKEMKL